MRTRLVIAILAAAAVILLLITNMALGQSPNQLAACTTLGFSTEEDFVTHGPLPPDGNAIISDGDLLGPNHSVCMRNAQLLAAFQVSDDLGLDAVDIVDVGRQVVAFSTELDSPTGSFTAGDLLTTHGAVIPNQAILFLFGTGNLDLGLDGIQLIGAAPALITFLESDAKTTGRAGYLKDPGTLSRQLRERNIDLWFTTEGTFQTANGGRILDGDLLSARDGNVVMHIADLLPALVPAGLPARGVDFGLDAVAAPRNGDRSQIRFSTEILYRGRPSFDDGDILKQGDGIVIPSHDLVAPFEPSADFLGIDALYMNLETPTLERRSSLPLLYWLRQALGLNGSE